MITKSFEREICFNIIKNRIKEIKNNNLNDSHAMMGVETFFNSLVEEKFIKIKSIRFPDIRWFGDHGYQWRCFPAIYVDSMMLYHLFDSDYSERNAMIIEDWKCEGPYEFEDVRVEMGDFVIDAGAYIGDWSAVAAAEGGKVYAFEPTPFSFNILKENAFNNHFNAINMALGSETAKTKIEQYSYPASNSINNNGTIDVDITSLDEFVIQEDICVDFIKSDIEGFERYMLLGASGVLRDQEPKLAIRTYHNEGEDRYVLPKLIRKINPRYKIINRPDTIYCYVPGARK